jgi:hypothetical protein
MCHIDLKCVPLLGQQFPEKTKGGNQRRQNVQTILSYCKRVIATKWLCDTVLLHYGGLDPGVITRDQEGTIRDA